MFTANVLYAMEIMESVLFLIIAILFEVNGFVPFTTNSTRSSVESGLCTNEHRVTVGANERFEVKALCCPGYFMNDEQKCEECNLGRTGHNCMDSCPQGWYGRNCSSKCFCWSELCDPVSGRCLSDALTTRMSIGLFDVDQLRFTTFAIAFGTVIALGAIISAISMFLAYHYHYRKKPKNEMFFKGVYAERFDNRSLIYATDSKGGAKQALRCTSRKCLLKSAQPNNRVTASTEMNSNELLAFERSSPFNEWRRTLAHDIRDRFTTPTSKEALRLEVAERSTETGDSDTKRIHHEAFKIAMNFENYLCLVANKIRTAPVEKMTTQLTEHKYTTAQTAEARQKASGMREDARPPRLIGPQHCSPFKSHGLLKSAENDILNLSQLNLRKTKHLSLKGDSGTNREVKRINRFDG
ncbi:Platelet endothelial aggregation receptor 1 [Toxocara canis]|uniref:Platelet endothelial aggregation receptor 1 n=1 Tax=Toxocara canis TaxID=6265 RepID=A0A0B2UZ55_TOXCA|nr:Platelet endothelial aggregation receptor 1 [Toxocara canis]